MPHSYRRILTDADAFFRRILKVQPQHFQCGGGCSLCCYGLFEIGSGDLPLLADGLAKLPPARRNHVVDKAREIMESTEHPNVRNVSPMAKEKFFAKTAETPCPCLDDAGRCTIYEHRPLVCRTFGLPLRNGEEYLGDVCELNFTAATQDEKEAAAWDLQNEDELGREDEYTIPEAIVLIARLRGW